MEWNNLTDLGQLDQLVEESKLAPVLIFKHSRSCSISRTSLDRLERNWKLGSNSRAYFLDLITYRSISNEIASRFGVPHESPQVIIIQQGKAVYDRSHFDINYTEIEKQLAANAG
ncbi:MAG: bacillithiol system redox-active protein YtxJ [Cyclobacteriaceae bacterium]|nr:bacillithiol system redox-active protein YtxJ [Cyclobacteriaceae bacterium]